MVSDVAEQAENPRTRTRRLRAMARVALPQEHGAWVMFLGPLLIGLVAGGRLTVASSYLVVAAAAGFLWRQPVTMLAKVHGGRRPATEGPAAWRWMILYGSIAVLHVIGLVLRGHASLLYLALPAVPVLLWHLALVSRRAERGHVVLDVLAAGVLALSAPAGMWIGRGGADPRGWILWLLVWAGSSSAILTTVLQLEQKRWPAVPGRAARLRAGRAALACAGGGALASLGLGLIGVISPWVSVPFLLLLAEALRCTLRPALGIRPRRIGMRQLLVSSVFTVLLAWAWIQPAAVS